MPKLFKPVVNDTTVYVQGRISYQHLLEPAAPLGSNDKVYSCAVLIDKEDTASIDAVKQAINAAAKAGVASTWGGKKPKKLNSPLRDGDEKNDEKDGQLPEFAGKMFFNCKSKRAPAVLNRKKAPIIDPEEVYSGMWAIVCVNMFPYSNAGNNGVGAALNAILKTADDEAFAGSTGGAHSFDSIQIDIDDDEEEDDDVNLL